MGMMAAVEQPNGKLCIVKWTGRTGMIKVGIITYCGREASPEAGVMQVPDAVFNIAGRTVSSVQNPATQLKPCLECTDTVRSQ